MATSIVKLSKSFFVKLLVGIIILPFVFWGMGDVFRGGNQNVIATIDSNKVNTQEFVKYLNRLSLKDDQIQQIKNSNLLEKILSEYIGRKVMSLEIKRLGIIISDSSLRDIIKNDKLFSKDNKFSRTAYEKFLLKSNVTAPTFEKNIVEQESRRQFLSYLAGGISVPDTLIKKAFNKENQVKKIKYIDLDKYYSKQKFSQNKIKEVYEKNKSFFVEEFKTLQYAEIIPISLTGKNDYDEAFFNNLDTLENKILDGQSFADSIKENNLKAILIKDINKNKKNKENKSIANISEQLFKKIFSLKNKNSPEVFKIENKYYLAEIKTIEKINKTMKDPKVLSFIKKQLYFQNKLEKNQTILKDINMGGFDKTKLEEFASKNELMINEYKISSLKQNDVFSEAVIKRIFQIEDSKINLINNNDLTKNFLILSIKTEFKDLNKDSNQYEQYEAKARLSLVNDIYRIFDQNLNQKYKVEINKRTVDRVKNSF